MDPYRPPGYQAYMPTNQPSPYGPPSSGAVPPNMYHQMPPGMAPPTGYPQGGVVPGAQPMMRPMIRPMGFPGAPVPQVPPMGAAPPPNNDKLTTLFVGKIPQGIPDDWLEKILQTCGTVVKWNRLKDPSGNPKGFGFCEYADAEGILRALRVLGGEGQDPESAMNIPSIAEGGIPKKLLLKADDKTRQYLDQFEATRNSSNDSQDDLQTRQEIQKVIESMLEALLGSEATSEQNQDTAEPSAKTGNSTKNRSSHHDDRSHSRDQRHDRRERSPTSSEEEAEEERRAEKRRREMEMAYREREKRWENHEISRAKMYERNATSDREREERRIRERDFMEKRLREWKDDEEEELGEEEYYRDRARWWRHRQADRERELEQDERDRKLEQEKIKAAEAEAAAAAAAAKKAEEIRLLQESITSNGSNHPDNTELSSTREHTKLKLSLSTKKSTVAPVANNDGNGSSDEESEGKKRKRILVPLEYSDDEDDETKALRKKHKIKELVKEIPADKEGLWNWNMKWDYITDSVLKTKIQPFVAKKIVEYLGVEEKELVTFVTEHVRKHNPPQALVDELAMALDDEAPVFVMKLWRMVIYESEAHARKLA
ncbi:hypothetical protein K493DRAFT_282272 [Basidiobolus meristosporus CBS 931.73]|uniref:PWI domain-containing protein n=1 Tax=Basidiobolus meristosporus CBS 931.73 TaxID=1314790 RepID=A0A1Y1YDT6_9FUNG|nr:hypothetical protein K493DRAFT_282272 [Basidiobolus meristosporus CBS 931.73]|eukprot:ORX96105.1 hypothetical protein K493DRAFT_282272 [Basidiobolus meristosporus CBS 931.73]